MKIANKIGLSFFTVTVICTVTALSFFYFIAKSNLQRSIEASLNSVAQSRTAHIKTYLGTLKISVGQLSKSVVLKNLLKIIGSENLRQSREFETAMTRLRETREANPAIYEFLLLDKTGRVIASSNEKNIGADKSTDAYFLGGQKEIFIKDAYYSETLKEPLLAVSAPFSDGQTGELLGVLAARVKLDDLWNITTERAGMRKTGEIYIVNKYGFMITPSRFLKDTFLKQAVDTEHVRRLRLHRDKKRGLAEEQKEIVNIFTNYRGDRVLGTHEYIPQMQWGVLAEINTKEAFAPLDELRLFFIEILFITALAAWLLSRVIARFISGPINKLYNGTEIIGRGNFDYKVGTDVNDEVGQLSRAFDRMTENLKNITTSVNNLNQEITERKQAEKELKRIEWMLSSRPSSPREDGTDLTVDEGYGDLTELNRDGIILNSVGKDFLRDIVNDYLTLMGTSSAIYEKNGDYALGIFSSSWCRFLDRASRKLCDTGDNTNALNSGKWLCHESWTCCSKEVIAKHASVDMECNGGIRLYSVPIFAGKEIIGAINFGYGDPPREPAKIREIAELYKVDYNELVKKAESYNSRPPYIVEMAKKRLHDSARLIGVMVDQKRVEENLNQTKTDLEKAYQQLQESFELESYLTIQAQSASAVKSQFVANISHEIRTPLNGIIGVCELLLENKMSKEQLEYIQIIHSSAESLLNIINTTLDFSKIEAGKMELEHIDFNLMDIVKDISSVLAVNAAKKKLELVNFIEPNVPLNLNGDPGRLRQILFNLTGNAIKFTSEGKITLIAALAEEKEGKAVLRFSVRDTGIGIPADKTNLLFNAFSQVDASLSRKFGGTGLGLAISKRLVEQMGGSIGVESVHGKGSTFWFIIPFLKQWTAAQPSELPARSGKVLEEKNGRGFQKHKQYHPGKSLRILVAEDNLANQIVILGILEKMGHSAHAVADGKEAVKMLETIPCDLVLMDIQMPEMDGLEATTIIRDPKSQVRDHNIPILAITAHSIEDDWEKCLSAGMNGYITKPVSIRAIADAIVNIASSSNVITHHDEVPLKDRCKGKAGDLSADSSVVFDSRTFSDRLSGDGALIREIIDVFLDETPKNMRELEKNIKKEQQNDAARLAHTVKGSAANVGGQKLHAVALKIESACNAGDWRAAEALIPGLSRQFEIIEQAMREYLKKTEGT